MNSSRQPATHGRSNPVLLVAILGGVCALGPVAVDLYLPGLPRVATDLGASALSIQLTLTTFLVGLGAGQLLIGPLSDRLGRRRPLLAGLGLFTVSSALCAAAPTAEVLVAARLLEGIGASAGVVIANAVVTDYFRGRKAARLLSRLVLVSGMAPIIGPLLGAQLLGVTSWRGIFVVVAALGALSLVAAAFGLRESLPPARRVAGGLGRTVASIGVLSRDAAFMGLTISAALTFAAFFAYLSASSFVIQGVYGASPVLFSILFSFNAVGWLLGSQLNHLLLRRFSPRSLLAAGLAVAVVAGMAVLGVTLVGGSSVVALSVPLFVLVSATGFASPDSTALALSRHPEMAGSASAYFGSLRLGLAALATPLVGLGGGVSAKPMAVVIASASVGALVVFAVVARRVRGEVPQEPVPQTAGEAVDDVAVG